MIEALGPRGGKVGVLDLKQVESCILRVKGFKEVIALISGQGVYSRFKFESGTHRVQRVPETEAQGRIHTSAMFLKTALPPQADATA